MDIEPIDQGDQKLSSLLQIVLNHLLKGRVDIALEILPEIIRELKNSDQ